MTDYHYSINASDLDYNMLFDYISNSNIDVLSLWWIVPIVVIMVFIINSYTIR